MNELESQILHHHAIALNYLCGELANLTGKPPADLKAEAFRQALEAWRTQPPPILEAMLDLNIAALREAMAVDRQN